MSRWHSSSSKHDLQHYVPPLAVFFPHTSHPSLFLPSRDDKPTPPNPRTAGLFGRLAKRGPLACFSASDGHSAPSDGRPSKRLRWLHALRIMKTVLGRDVQGTATSKRRRLAVPADFSTWCSEEFFSKEFENQDRSQRLRGQQIWDGKLPVLMTAYQLGQNDYRFLGCGYFLDSSKS